MPECRGRAGSNATGAFQMINSTYSADINGAIAEDPAIAGSIVSGLAGRMDPGTEAYAAAYEFGRMRNCCRRVAIADPTVLQSGRSINSARGLAQRSRGKQIAQISKDT